MLYCYTSFSQTVKIVTNQVGYNLNSAKHAVIVANHADSIDSFQLLDADGKQVFTGKPVYTGPVDQWKSWVFYTIDFTLVNPKAFIRFLEKHYAEITNDGKENILDDSIMISELHFLRN